MSSLIDRFLSLFETYQALRRQAAESGEARVAAEDEIRRLRARESELQADLAEARKDATLGRELVADWLAQHLWGQAIFKRSISLPEADPNPKPLSMGGRVQARQAVNEATLAFAQQWKESLEKGETQ